MPWQQKAVTVVLGGAREGALGATRQRLWGQPNSPAKSTPGGEVGASQSQANSSMALDQFLAQNARLGG